MNNKVRRNVYVATETLGRAKGGIHTDRVMMISEFSEMFNELVGTIIVDTIIPVTYDELYTLKNTSSLLEGNTYKITDRYNYQQNGTGNVPNTGLKGDDRGIVYVKALSSNTLSKQVVREMACPIKYTNGVYVGLPSSIGIFNINKVATFGCGAIWGGKVWSNSNISGTMGVPVNDFTLDGSYWNYIDKENNPNYYIDKQFIAFYDFDNDWFETQYDGASNQVGIPFAAKGGVQVNPCDITDWNFTASSFYNNKAPFGVFNNSVGYLVDNICRGQVSGNYGNYLMHNQCNNIKDNTITYLNYNYSYNIEGNNGTFLVYNRNVDGDIVLNNVNNLSYNSNFGYIYNNTCSNLARNTNAGVIDGNTCVNLIDNANQGDIMYCTVTQNIERNSSKIPSILSITGQYCMSDDTLHTSSTLLGYEKTITGLSSVDLTVALAPYISKVLLKSTNATEVITDILNPLNNKIVRFSPDAGLIVTFNHNAAKIRCEGAINAVLNGSNSDWVEFDKVSNFNAVKQYNIGTY